MVIGTALGFTSWLTTEQIPQQILALIQDKIDDRLMFLVMLNVFLLIVGCMMDIFSATLVVVPLIVPVALEHALLVALREQPAAGLELGKDIGLALVRGSELRELLRIREQLSTIAGRTGALAIRRKGELIAEPARLVDVVDHVGVVGRANLSIQRYKGLGEMNPEQLRETTMEPERRSLMKVTLADTIEADEIFSILMGDAVEPRKEFITAHAKEVTELDI